MNSSNTKLFLSLSLLFCVSFGTMQVHAATEVDVDVKSAQSMNIQGALLLDVREQDEYSEVHATNVALIPLSQLAARLDKITVYKGEPITVMCHSGRRSTKAVHLLQQADYTHVSNVTGGIMA